MKKIFLQISGMHCESCEKIINMELKEVPGFLSAVIDSKSGEGTVDLEDNVDENLILEAIKKAGYLAEIIRKEDPSNGNDKQDMQNGEILVV